MPLPYLQSPRACASADDLCPQAARYVSKSSAYEHDRTPCVPRGSIGSTPFSKCAFNTVPGTTLDPAARRRDGAKPPRVGARACPFRHAQPQPAHRAPPNFLRLRVQSPTELSSRRSNLPSYPPRGRLASNSLCAPCPRATATGGCTRSRSRHHGETNAKLIEARVRFSPRLRRRSRSLLCISRPVENYHARPA